jgi:uncharacterized lipoprotein YajG
MKKRVVLPFIAMSFLFAGCGKQSTSDKSSPAFSETKASAEETVSKETSETKQSETSEESEKTKSLQNEQLSGFEESQKLEEVLGDTADLNVKTLSENHNKRVLLLFDEGQTKKYKSVFIKNTEHLKVIDEISGDLLFDSKI